MEDGNQSDSGNAFGWVVLLILILLGGWLIFRYAIPVKTDSNSDINVDVNLPTNQPDDSPSQ